MSTTQALYTFILFLCGLFVGSLTNTVAYRWPLGIHPLRPPCFCPKCNQTIAPPDTVPLLGYILRKGRCRHCHSAIHPLHPVAEFVTAALYAVTGYTLAPLSINPIAKIALVILTLAFISSLFLAAVIDWHHHVIPDAVTIPGAFAALAASPVLPHLHHAETQAAFSRHHPYLSHLLPGQQPWQHSIAASLTGAFVGLGFGLAIHVLGSLMFRKRVETINADSAMGIGDVKLLVYIGAFLGWKSVPLTLAVGSVLGAATGCMVKLHTGSRENLTGWSAVRQKWRTGISIMPFGPFLAVGAVAYLFLWR